VYAIHGGLWLSLANPYALLLHMHLHLMLAKKLSAHSAKLSSREFAYVLRSSERLPSISLHLLSLGAFFNEHFKPVLNKLSPHFQILVSLIAVRLIIRGSDGRIRSSLAGIQCTKLCRLTVMRDDGWRTHAKNGEEKVEDGCGK
jgi:hypothetical protein